MSIDSSHSVTTPTEPGLLAPDFGQWFRSSKRNLVDSTQTGTVVQTGGAYVGEHFLVPDVPDELLHLDEPAIETFVVDSDGRCTPTGSDEALIGYLRAPAEAMAEATLSAMTAAGVDLGETAYLTGSITPTGQVTTTAHVDDDQYVEADGIGLVAIAAKFAGPRLAVGSLAHLPLRPGLPLEFSTETLELFDQGRVSAQQAGAERIVVFPQFGQLHSGPLIGADQTPPDSQPIRTLLVLRAATVPSRES